MPFTCDRYGNKMEVHSDFYCFTSSSFSGIKGKRTTFFYGKKTIDVAHITGKICISSGWLWKLRLGPCHGRHFTGNHFGGNCVGSRWCSERFQGGNFLASQCRHKNNILMTTIWFDPTLYKVMSRGILLGWDSNPWPLYLNHYTTKPVRWREASLIKP